jgi:hypothetical protein
LLGDTPTFFLGPLAGGVGVWGGGWGFFWGWDMLGWFLGPPRGGRGPPPPRPPRGARGWGAPPPDTSLRKAKNVIGIPVPLHRLERWVGSPPFGNCSVVGRWSSVVGWVERSETHQRLGCFEDGFRCALPILQRWKHPDFRKKPPAHREYLRNLWCIGVASWSQSEFGNQQIRQTNTGLVRQLVGVLSDSSAV